MSAHNFLRMSAIAIGLAVLAGCTGMPPKPPHDTPEAHRNTDPVQTDYRLALNDLKAGKDDDALALFKTLTQAHPELATAYVNIGLIELKKGDLKAAESALLNAAALKPELAVTHNELGVVYRRLGRFDEAEAAYLKALQCEPEYAGAHLNLGILYDIYLNKLDDALAQYESYQALTGGGNDLVNKWIIDIKQRLAAGTRSNS